MSRSAASLRVYPRGTCMGWGVLPKQLRMLLFSRGYSAVLLRVFTFQN